MHFHHVLNGQAGYHLDALPHAEKETRFTPEFVSEMENVREAPSKCNKPKISQPALHGLSGLLEPVQPPVVKELPHTPANVLVPENAKRVKPQ